MTALGESIALTAEPRSAGYWTGVARRFRGDPVAVGAGVVGLLIILLAVFAPYLGLADPYRSSMLHRLKPIGTAGLPLGSDELGRDMLARLIHGGRLSAYMGVTPVVI